MDIRRKKPTNGVEEEEDSCFVPIVCSILNVCAFSFSTKQQLRRVVSLSSSFRTHRLWLPFQNTLQC